MILFFFLALEAAGYCLSVSMGDDVDLKLRAKSTEQKVIGYLLYLWLVVVDALPVILLILLVASMGIPLAPALPLLLVYGIAFVIKYLLKFVPQSMQKAFDHYVFVHWLTVVSIVLFGGFLFARSPEYYSRILRSGDGQPAGWWMAIVLACLFGVLVLWSIIVTKKERRKGTWRYFLNVAIFLVLACALVLILLLAPSIAFVLSSTKGG